MNKGVEYICNNVSEVKEATLHLDIAQLMPIKVDDGGILKDVTNFVGVYNVSKGKFCAAVVPYYNLVGHKQYFDSFAEALERLNIEFKMTLKSAGHKAFADIEFEGRNLKFTKLNEEFTTGIRLVNSYDKSTGIFVIPRYTRLACTNGMVLSRSEKTLSIKHHSKIVQEIEAFVERKLNNIITENEDLKNWVSESIADSIEWEYACNIVGKLFTQIKHREQVLKRLDISVVVTKDKKTKKQSVEYVWDDEKVQKKKLTRWEIYNAITQYITHGEQITPFIENIFNKKAEKMLITPLQEMPVLVVK